MKARANLGALRPDFAMDTFCVGLILLQLLHEHGLAVFATNEEATDHLSGRAQPVIPDKAFGGVKDRYHKLLKLVLAEAPEGRPSVQKILDDDIFSKSNRTLLNQIKGELVEINTAVKALSGSLSSFRQEALEGIASVRTSTTEGVLALADLKAELREGGQRLEAMGSASAAEMRQALLDGTSALARSLKSFSGAQAEQAVEQTFVLARLEKLQAEIQAQVATLRDDQREDLMSARQELLGLLRAVEGKVDDGFESIKADMAALKGDVSKGLQTLNEGMEQRDAVALANAAALKRNIDALYAMVTSPHSF